MNALSLILIGSFVSSFTGAYINYYLGRKFLFALSMFTLIILSIFIPYAKAKGLI